MKEATEGWDKVRLAFVWGDWQPGMKGLFTSDGTRAYIFIRKKLAPSGIETLWWAGGSDGPFYCFAKEECAAVGDAGWYGYADPI
ncbi:MAG: hypothetical protein QOG54_1820 [Actinomycetota bacterium]|jgi:hypothetical protein|nr:hypothetical protein [Actinomycetota bacterium]